MFFVNIKTAVSTIIVTHSSIDFILTDTISNQCNVDTTQYFDRRVNKVNEFKGYQLKIVKEGLHLDYHTSAMHSCTIFSNFSLFGATMFQIYEVKSATMFGRQDVSRATLYCIIKVIIEGIFSSYYHK